ncbi:MAG: hypothetical protein ACPGSC_00065 [Granulosicoccaceae bacterium]
MGIKRLIAIAALALSLGTAAQADTPFGHISAASQHSAQASAHASAAGVKGVSAVVAVPFLAVGSVGAVSQQVGEAALQLATKPLPIGDEVVHQRVPKAAAQPAKTPSPDLALRSNH